MKHSPLIFKDVKCARLRDACVIKTVNVDNSIKLHCISIQFTVKAIVNQVAYSFQWPRWLAFRWSKMFNSNLLRRGTKISYLHFFINTTHLQLQPFIWHGQVQLRNRYNQLAIVKAKMLQTLWYRRSSILRVGGYNLVMQKGASILSSNNSSQRREYTMKLLSNVYGSRTGFSFVALLLLLFLHPDATCFCTKRTCGTVKLHFHGICSVNLNRPTTTTGIEFIWNTPILSEISTTKKRGSAEKSQRRIKFSRI